MSCPKKIQLKHMILLKMNYFATKQGDQKRQNVWLGVNQKQTPLWPFGVLVDGAIFSLFIQIGWIYGMFF